MTAVSTAVRRAADSGSRRTLKGLRTRDEMARGPSFVVYFVREE
jgi:hypothetical protein